MDPNKTEIAGLVTMLRISVSQDNLLNLKTWMFTNVSKPRNLAFTCCSIFYLRLYLFYLSSLGFFFCQSICFLVLVQYIDGTVCVMFVLALFFIDSRDYK